MKQLTVVFNSKNNSVYDRFLKAFKRIFPRSDKSSWSITAMSVDHEIRRVELLEDAIVERDLDKARDVLAMTNEQLNSVGQHSLH